VAADWLQSPKEEADNIWGFLASQATKKGTSASVRTKMKGKWALYQKNSVRATNKSGNMGNTEKKPIFETVVTISHICCGWFFSDRNG